MRFASENQFEVQPNDSIDFVIEETARTLNALREIHADKPIAVTMMIDIHEVGHG